MKNEGSIWLVPGISATFIGTVIGAGFASGQEIYQFFSLHGLYGFLGLILAVVLLGLAGERVFKIGYILKPKSYRELLVFLIGERLTPVVDFLLFSFFIILTGIMLAGSGSIFQAMNLGYWTGVVITASLLIVVLFFDLPGLVSANLLVIPLMFAGSIGIALYAIHTKCTVTIVGSFDLNWVPASLQFSAYNLVLALPVLLSLAKEYPSIPWLKCGSWLGSIGLGLMAGFIHWALICHLPHLQKSALPMMDLAKMVGKWPYLIYAAVLWGEMFTTLLANAYGVTQRLVALSGQPFRYWLIIVTIIGMIIAKVGFVSLIARFYPLFGYLCFIIMVLLFIKKPGKFQAIGNRHE